MSAIRPARSSSTVLDHPVVLGDHVPDPAPQLVVRQPRQRVGQVVDRRCRAATARPRIVAARSQEARRLPYSPSASECATLVSMTSTARPSCGRVERDVLDGVRPGVEQQHGARAARRRRRSDPSARTARRRSRSPPAGRAGRSPAASSLTPDSADAASAVTHSTAADEDSPAPDGTWESSARSNPPIGWPACAQRPDGADQVARPGSRDRRVRARMSSSATVVTGAGPLRRGHPDDDVVVRPPAARLARASMANGSTRPPV